MKTRLFQFASVVLLMTLSLSLSAAGGNRSFEDYTIKQMEYAELFTGVDAAWTLTYDNQESSILISFKKNKNCKTYVVRGDHFEVVYECSPDGFGARMVKKSERMFPQQLTAAVLNSEELAKQRILTPNRVDDERALGLIAAFLPDLVNPSYRHLLN
ncbi:hypothetical protein [Mangrovibacterium marinum]|uniref:Uncharacterized protein n=1 Tax=Mangrovibacterium marinum TaxID=1639118 RepID=A0A2T5C3J2_9BACT|nr:hypothetical protein [Mangrovibacterium marinum]PTN09341.1 hypothetical protein C8N47_105182 [Mangrovibacterium marinum]